MIKVESSVSTTEYTGFDILGKVTGHKQTTDGQDYTTSYVYNLSGALVEQTYPSGRVVKNVLDNNGDLSIVQSKKNSNFGFHNYATNFSYNAAGAVTSMQLGNGKWESTQFNSRLQPIQIALGTIQNGHDKLKLEYGYGTTANNGNVLGQKITVKRPSQADLVFDQAYTYDSLNRITSATETTGETENWKQVYTFDRYGNRNFDEEETTTLPKGCLDGSDPVVCEADRKIFNPELNASNNRIATGQSYTYDAAGNVVTDAEGRQFTYDAENKQVEVENAMSQIVGQYFFDGNGKRVKKVVPSTGEVTVFVYDAGAKLIGEYSTVVETTAPKVQYLTNDHLGSPRMNTDQDGQVTSRTDYMPYGEEIIALGNRTSNENYTSDDVRQGFTGYENDTETGLDFAQARMYSKTIGRFNGADPLYITLQRLNDPQQLPLYSYARNNPLRFSDPLGLDITVTGDYRDDYLNRLDNLTPSFDVSYDKKNRIVIVGEDGKKLSKKQLKALGGTLEGAEKELFNAITDKKNHVTIGTTRNDPSFDFGRFEGNGKNTIDFADVDVLDKPANSGGPIGDQVVGHETLEAYASAKNKRLTQNVAHTIANEFFPGLSPERGRRIQGDLASQIATQEVQDYRVEGTKVQIQVTRELVPKRSVQELQRLPSNVYLPGNVIDVRKLP